MTQDTGTAGKIDATLAERGSRYGSWREQSRVTQNIKAAFRTGANWDKLPEYMRESLEQIANKFARILSGDYTHVDNWHDTVGYASLAEDCLNQDIAAGIKGPVVIDPDNPPMEWLFKKLQDLGFEIAVSDSDSEAIILDPSKVRDPAFLRDPVRAFLAGEHNRE